MADIQDAIRDQVSKHRVVLYMKGTPQFPQCGFSATVAEILKRCGVSDYASFNVLQDAGAQLLKDVGFGPSDIAQGVQSAFQLGPQDTAQILKNLGYGVGEITAVLKDVFQLGVSVIADILHAIGL